MSTVRFVGDASVRLTYLDRAPGFSDLRGGYRCAVRAHNGERRTIIVGEPRVIERSVDSPEAFDDAARAAIAFAEDNDCEGGPLDINYDFETVGCADRIVVQRKRAR